MSNIIFDSITTFPNDSQLVVSTRHLDHDSFTREFFEANQGSKGHWDLRLVSNHLEGFTCLATQNLAYDYAERLYPASGVEMKQQPYLIWVGPGNRTSMFSSE